VKLKKFYFLEKMKNYNHIEKNIERFIDNYKKFNKGMLFKNNYFLLVWFILNKKSIKDLIERRVNLTCWLNISSFIFVYLTRIKLTILIITN
jgi:hypothetical protein